jgi:hypothetical protein
MALVSEIGSEEGGERWVKEGAQLGHFVVHEIRRGAIVCRAGEQVQEITVDRDAGLRSIVRAPRPEPQKVSAAIPANPVPVPGPNDAAPAARN